MEKAIKELLDRYNRGEITEQEEVILEQYIEQGVVQLEDIHDLHALNANVESLPIPEPSPLMTEGFYHELTSRKKAKSINTWWNTVWKIQPGFQWAYSIILIVLGIGVGYFMRPQAAGEEQIQQLSSEVTEMKEMMMLSLLEKESTSDRLRAVNLTSELPDVSRNVTNALFKTLNTDENVNVRLATIEALQPYVQHPDVRKGLIDAIAQQDSPLVQIALAELMVALQEKRSVGQLEQLLNKEETPREVRERIEESIKVLI